MRTPGTAIVCGSGPAVWAELAQARVAAPEAAIIGVNLTALFLAHVDHLVSLHPELVGPLRDLRASCDWVPAHQQAPATHSRRDHPGVDHVWPLPPQGRQGTSSLFAVHVAFGLGYERVILAGVPLDGARRFFDPPGAPQWRGGSDPRGIDGLAQDRRPWEEAARTWFEGRVRSAGGWTADLLGGIAA